MSQRHSTERVETFCTEHIVLYLLQAHGGQDSIRKEETVKRDG